MSVKIPYHIQKNGTASAKEGEAVILTKDKSFYKPLILLAKLPIDPKLAALWDRGMLELMENDYLDDALREIIKATNED